jgi:hypothetical protein
MTKPYSIEKYQRDFTLEALNDLYDFPYPVGHEEIIEERRKIRIAIDTYPEF